MTLKHAKFLRNLIIRDGIHCIVPLGHGPDKYFARIFTANGPRDFHGPQDYRDYEIEKQEREHERRMAIKKMEAKHRSPIEIMIDRACGLD